MIQAMLITLGGATAISCLIMPVIFEILAGIYSRIPWPFSRVFDRVFLFFLLMFILYYRKTFKLEMLSMALTLPAEWSKRVKMLFIGGLVTSTSVVLCAIAIFVGDSLSVNPREPVEVLHKVLIVMPCAFFIALIEELFFRVLFLELLTRYLLFSRALIISALVYALVHFITPDKSFVFKGGGWWEGFLYLPALVERLIQPGTALGVAGLFVIGIILGLAKKRYQTVYLVIGMHAGWIFSLKMISFLSLTNPHVLQPIGLTGRYVLFGQYWSWLSFLIVLILLFVIERLGLIKRFLE
jgi:uncharacterized protein